VIVTGALDQVDGADAIYCIRRNQHLSNKEHCRILTRRYKEAHIRSLSDPEMLGQRPIMARTGQYNDLHRSQN
jgi:hypothetical protein